MIINIKSKLVDSFGNPIPLAHVVIDQYNGVVTDEYGNFSFEADSKSIATFSHIGMKTKSLGLYDIKDKVVLENDTNMLNEVLVIADKKKVVEAQKKVEKPFYKTAAFKVGAGLFLVSCGIYFATKKSSNSGLNYAQVEL